MNLGLIRFSSIVKKKSSNGTGVISSEIMSRNNEQYNHDQMEPLRTHQKNSIYFHPRHLYQLIGLRVHYNKHPYGKIYG